MRKQDFIKINDWLWEIPKSFRKDMKVSARIYASKKILEDVEDNALKQLVNITTLPGIAKYAIAMPDIHSGYGPPIGGLAAMKLSEGVISPSFVGFDENCGCRILLSNYTEKEIKPYLNKLSDEIQKQVPSGLGRGRKIKLTVGQIDKILDGGVPELVKQGYGEKEDIENCEEQGKMKQADASCISEHAKNRGRDQVGTLGSGNHFCQLDRVSDVFDKRTAETFGLFKDQLIVFIHTGSRGLGHQNCTDYLKITEQALSKYKIKPVDKELSYVPFDSLEGQRFFKAMSAVCNYAWANRHMIAYYTKEAFKKILGEKAKLKLLYDVAHNIAKIEEHEIDGKKTKLILHRKGATRAFPPNHPEIPERYRKVGQPVLLPGSMGSASYILTGTKDSKDAWHTVSHGAGRIMSRRQAMRTISAREVMDKLKQKGIIVKCRSIRGIAEEAPSAYKDIDNIVEIVHNAGLSKKVVKLIPLVVVKGE